MGTTQSRSRVGRKHSPGRHPARRDDAHREVALGGGVAQRMPTPVTQAQVLHLQRTAGNRAVSSLIGPKPATVQRLTTTTGDLDKLMGKSKTGTFGIGGSSYAELRKALAKYEDAKAKDEPGAEAGLMVLLDKVDRLATKWVNTHKGDAARAARLRSLVDEVAVERLAISKKQTEQQYMSSMAAGYDKGGVTPPAPKGAPHMFLQGSLDIGISAFTKYEADIQSSLKLSGSPDDPFHKQVEAQALKRRQFVEKYNLSGAEAAAIRIYTLASVQYSMMNAATANDKDWIAGVLSDKSNQMLKTKGVGEKELREEGGIHTAMAMQGLKKLPPYKGKTYRGEGITQADFDTNIKPGSKRRFGTLTSSSRLLDVAQGYRAKGMNAGRPVGILWEFENVGGRHVEAISEVEGEAEVLLPVATEVVITDVIYEKNISIGPMYRIKTFAMPKAPAPSPFTRRPLPA